MTTIDTNTAATDPSLWWKQAVVYQVYPRSFKDTTGSGLGDIAGVTAKIPYLKELGVDAIWLSPFYPSQLADGGYVPSPKHDDEPGTTPTSPQTGYDLGIGSVVMTIAVSGGVAYVCTKKARARA